jgi:tRNA pseudouridine13 synthase
MYDDPSRSFGSSVLSVDAAAMFVYKLRPADFRVREAANFPTSSAGAYAVYTLSKTGGGTLEALAEIRATLELEPFAVSFGGLKDAHAETAQTVTILDGPKEDRRFDRSRLRYLGQSLRPFTSEDILGNDFEIVLRDVAATPADDLASHAMKRCREPFPNYFDEQRFGSRGADGGFVAQAWCRGDFGEALRRATATLRQTDPLRRGIGNHLQRRPGDFRGAFALVPSAFRSLYLAAFQSWLWNRLLDAELRSAWPAETLGDIDVAGQRFAVPRFAPSDGWQAWVDRELPLPAARQKIGDAELVRRMEGILSEFGMTYPQLRVDFPRDSQFSRGTRRAFVAAENFRAEAKADSLHADKSAVRLEFRLPPGAYATTLLKVLAARVAHDVSSPIS